MVPFTCCLGVFMAGFDTTVVSVALPSVQGALHASVRGLQWTIDACTLVIACLLMLSGSLADRFGRRRVFQAGQALLATAERNGARLAAGTGPAPEGAR